MRKLLLLCLFACLVIVPVAAGSSSARTITITSTSVMVNDASQYTVLAITYAYTGFRPNGKDTIDFTLSCSDGYFVETTTQTGASGTGTWAADVPFGQGGDCVLQVSSGSVLAETTFVGIT